MSGKDVINWQAIRAELIWEDGPLNDVRENQRLQKRAEQYAAPVQDDTSTSQNQMELVFDLGAERYGIDVMLVRGLRVLPRMTPVPGTPSFYKGVVNLRGQIITVMDLRPFINIGSGSDDRHPPEELVVVRSGRLEIALLAHHVHGVALISQAEITPMSDIRYTRGVTRHRLVLLDIAAMFEDERLVTGGPEA